jgi:hypothetical protein
MKRLILLVGLAISAAFFGLSRPVSALQSYYLLTSPDGKTRVTVSQRLLRRVGDRMEYEYPVRLVDKKTSKTRELFTAAAPLVRENNRGIFHYNSDALKVEWAPSGDKLVVFWEKEEGVWTVLWVDRATGEQKCLDKELRTGLLKKIGRKGDECESPTVSLFKWLTPLKPVFLVNTRCGEVMEEGKKDFHKMAPLEHWVMYDAAKDLFKDCPDCAQEKAMKIFTKKPKPTVTPTPLTEETPTAQ